MHEKVINFTNKETNQNVQLTLDKNMIFIYGKNGSGKTTFSKSVDLDKDYVFNEEFIYKNVYIIDNNGAKSDVNTKNGLSELFIGEDIVSIKRVIDELELTSKKVKESQQVLITEISKTCSSFNITDFSEALSLSVDDLIYNKDKNLAEQLADFKYVNRLSSTIRNDDELKTIYEQVVKVDNLINLTKLINSNELLDDWLFSNDFDKIKNFNNELDDLYNLYKEKESVEKIIESKKIDLKLLPQIRMWLESHKDRTDCMFCGNDDILKSIEEWNILFKAEVMEKEKTVNEKIEAIKNLISRIIGDESIYITVAPKVLSNIKNLNSELNEILKSIIIKEKKYISTTLKDNDPIAVDIKDKIKQITNYILLPHEKSIVFHNSLLLSNSKTITQQKTLLDKKLSENAEAYSSNINSILSDLGLEKEIEISVDRGGGNYKYALKIKNGEINYLSDGQKHKLALAIFLSCLKKLPLKDKELVFDDPVISLDELGYHLFRNYLIKNIMGHDPENKPNLIILTHNFNYLYIQINNIINNPDFSNETKILRLTNNGFKEMDISLFKLDDIALLKEALQKIKYREELIMLGSLYFKIFREFLDIKLRVLGKQICDNPDIEIDELNYDHTIIEELKVTNSKLNSISKDRKLTYDESVCGLKCLKYGSELLGFSEYITDNELEKIVLLIDADGNESNEIFLMVEEIRKIIHSNDRRMITYKNYLSHPRISFTKSIMATSMDL